MFGRKIEKDPQKALDNAKKTMNSGLTGGLTKAFMGKDFVNDMNNAMDKGQAALDTKPVAKKRLERSLILDEISRQEKIEVDNESLDQEFNNTLVDLQMQGVNINKIRGGKQGQQRVAEALAMEFANRLLNAANAGKIESHCHRRI